MKLSLIAVAGTALLLAGTANAALDNAQATALLQKDGCIACHAVDRKLVGPSYQEVAAKYRGDKDAVAKLSKKVKDGGAGVWGPVPMPPHPQIADAEIRDLVTWIMTLKK